MLKIDDIDSQRMVIRVEQGKGGSQMHTSNRSACRSRRGVGRN